MKFFDPVENVYSAHIRGWPGHCRSLRGTRVGHPWSTWSLFHSLIIKFRQFLVFVLILFKIRDRHIFAGLHNSKYLRNISRFKKVKIKSYPWRGRRSSLSWDDPCRRSSRGGLASRWSLSSSRTRSHRPRVLRVGGRVQGFSDSRLWFGRCRRLAERGNWNNKMCNLIAANFIDQEVLQQWYYVT